jgi:CRISPR-associated RAMP protein (TIGR02581 family)
MHKRILNEASIEFHISTVEPLLIRSGHLAIEGPDMAPVLTWRGGARPEPYIPGSSLKGVLRSHAERIARTLLYEPAQRKIAACDPFLADAKKQDWKKPESFCGAKIEHWAAPAAPGEERKRVPGDFAYRRSCPICQLFGNTFLQSRIFVADAYLIGSWAREMRDGVGIDRFTGGTAHGAKFDLLAVTNATFKADIRLVNFELWQVGLLAMALVDLRDGLVRIGSGKSRGLGKVAATINHFEARYLVQGAQPEERLWGVGRLAQEQAYGFWDGEAAGVLIDGAIRRDDALGLRRVYRWEGDAAIISAWREASQLAANRLREYEMPWGADSDG